MKNCKQTWLSLSAVERHLARLAYFDVGEKNKNELHTDLTEKVTDLIVLENLPSSYTWCVSALGRRI